MYLGKTGAACTCGCGKTGAAYACGWGKTGAACTCGWVKTAVLCVHVAVLRPALRVPVAGLRPALRVPVARCTPPFLVSRDDGCVTPATRSVPTPAPGHGQRPSVLLLSAHASLSLGLHTCPRSLAADRNQLISHKLC